MIKYRNGEVLGKKYIFCDEFYDENFSSQIYQKSLCIITLQRKPILVTNFAIKIGFDRQSVMKIDFHHQSAMKNIFIACR